MATDAFSEMIKEALREVFTEVIRTSDLRTQRLLDPEQASEYIHVSRSRIYEMLREGELPVIKARRSTLIDKDDLNAWITANKRVGTGKVRASSLA